MRMLAFVCAAAMLGACTPRINTNPETGRVDVDMEPVTQRGEVWNAALASQQQAEMVATLGNVVYFEYDDATISAQGQAVLDAKIPILLANPALNIRVAGHTDERGSAEYNLALAQRRAIAVKGYLSTRGVSSNRIEAVSYGEEYPVAEGAMDVAVDAVATVVLPLASCAVTVTTVVPDTVWVMWMTELSCTLVPDPTTIRLKSPLRTAPNQTLAPSSTTTSPMRTAVGAIKASSATSGLLSSNGSKWPTRYLPVNEGARRSRAARTCSPCS